AVPVVSPTLAAELVSLLGTPEAAALAKPIASDNRITSRLVSAESGIDCAIEATHDEGWTLHGTELDALEGASAHELVVRARTDNGAAWFVVALDQTSVEREDQPSLDQSQRLGLYRFQGAAGTHLGPATSEIDARMTQVAHVLIAAQA